MSKETSSKPVKDRYEEIESHYLFKDLYHFMKHSSGMAIGIAYLLMTLSSMGYLYVFYKAFDIPIVSIVSLEDILATPLKNPNVLVVFFTIGVAVVLADMGNRWQARLNRKLDGKKPSIGIRILRLFIWVPKTKKTSITLVSFMVVGFLILYMVMFASAEAENKKKGIGHKVELFLSDTDKPQEVILLGVMNQFVIVYDHENKSSHIYPAETVNRIDPVSKQPDLTQAKSPPESEPEQSETTSGDGAF